MGQSILLSIFALMFFHRTFGQDVPNPYTSPSECGLPKPGYICDPQSIFSESERKEIYNKLDDFNSNAACGQCLSVLAMSKIQSGISTEEAHKMTKELAMWLTGKSGESGHWGFKKCERIAVIVLNRDQRYVWFQGGPDAGLCKEMEGIFASNKAPFARKDYAGGIKGMINTYARQYSSAYRSSSDCNNNTYPCKGSSGSAKNIDYKSTSELLRLLPNPESNPQACQIKSKGFVCDPDQVLTQEQRAELTEDILELNQNSCDLCIAVALLNKGRATRRTLVKTFKRLQKDWRFAKCKGVLTVFVSVANHFVWVNGDNTTVQCSKIWTLYKENQHYFGKNQIFDGIIGIVGSYADRIVSGSVCSDRTCGSKSGGSSKDGEKGSGAGGNMVGKKTKTKAVSVKKNDKVVLYIIIGGLIILCIMLCCCCIMCRKKLKSTATTAKTRFQNRGGRGGGGDGNVEYTARPRDGDMNLEGHNNDRGGDYRRDDYNVGGGGGGDYRRNDYNQGGGGNYRSDDYRVDGGTDFRRDSGGGRGGRNLDRQSSGREERRESGGGGGGGVGWSSEGGNEKTSGDEGGGGWGSNGTVEHRESGGGSGGGGGWGDSGADEDKESDGVGGGGGGGDEGGESGGGGYWHKQESTADEGGGGGGGGGGGTWGADESKNDGGGGDGGDTS